MNTEEFFKESREQSKIKAKIVAKYFRAWATVIMSTMRDRGGRLAYVDLFAGPGQYLDGTPSTPVIVIQTALKDPELTRRLVTYFNDGDPDNVQSLREAISEIPEVKNLRYEPRIENEDVGQKIVQEFQRMKLVPTLLFVDPWGYKGLSLALINSVVQNWGCDCIFFFNFNRINPGLSNDAVREHMNALFGEDGTESIRQHSIGMEPNERESLIIERLSSSLKELGARYVLPFTFKNEYGTRTSHHLIFMSKNFKGYEIMKDIMARESSNQDQGVPSFVYSPASKNNPFLFELSRPLDDLEGMLLLQFAGQTLTMRSIYEHHCVDKRYIKTNYKSVLSKMEAAHRIKAEPPAAKRPKRQGVVTFGDDVVVTFPRRSTQ
jgi:three-Cys-motif partner protein